MKWVRAVQGRLAEEHHQSLLLDASRRAYYKKTRKELKQNVLQADNEVVSTQEDPELKGAPLKFSMPQLRADLFLLKLNYPVYI